MENVDALTTDEMRHRVLVLERENKMLRDRAAVRDEQLAQSQENARMLYHALAKRAPEVLAELKPQLHANIGEMDKVVCEVTAAREEAARLRREVERLRALFHITG